MALRTLSAFMLYSVLSSTALNYLPSSIRYIRLFSFFIISCTNVLRRLLSMFNDVCYRLFPRLSRIICSVRLNLGVFENNEPFKHLLGFLRPEDRNIIKPLFYEKQPARTSMDILVKACVRSGFKMAQTVRALHFVLPVEFTCIRHFLSLVPSGCI